MQAGDIYFGKAEGLAKWGDYPIKIRLIRQVKGSHYSNEGDWEAVSYYYPNYYRNRSHRFPLGLAAELCQIWTEAQIKSTFEVPESGQNLVKIQSESGQNLV